MKESPSPYSRMYMEGSVNDLVLNTLPAAGSNPDAERYFLRLLTQSRNLFLLNPQALDLIRDYAEKGNKYAIFALGRYHLVTRVEPDSLEKAKEYIQKAYELGLPDAAAALAEMHAYGDFGIVDRARSREFLAEAIGKSSGYAGEIQLRNLVFGLHGCDKDPQKAIDIADRLISEDILNLGEGEENPVWYYWRGTALQETKGLTSALEDYHKAARMGIISAYADYALARSHNDRMELMDRDAYIEVLEIGKSKQDSLCTLLSAMTRVEEYDKLPEHTKDTGRKTLLADLEKAYRLGSRLAAEILGDIYWYGEYGVEENNELAWQWYAKGALIYSPGCYEKMFEMVRTHYIDKDEKFRDMLALHGARLGSEKLLNETVIAYTYGRLTEFATEIEQYYVPVFDDEDESYCVGDCPDDDGSFDAYA